MKRVLTQGTLQSWRSLYKSASTFRSKLYYLRRFKKIYGLSSKEAKKKLSGRD